MIPAAVSPIANHLWQSTAFAGAAWLLTLALRKSQARVRHWVWVAASLKFLAPFSLLIGLGSQVPWRAAKAPAGTGVAIALDQVSQPFAAPVRWPEVVAVTSPRPWGGLPEILWMVWGCGFLGVGTWWALRWRRVAAAVRAGSALDLGIPIRAVASPAFIEPGIFGAFRPILLLPEGIFEYLTPAQMKSVLAHELCHVRRRDNLVGMVQMLVETVFWFHPLTWWIGKRILEERERACDEEVVKLGNEPRVYARGILKVCELYLESPLPCAAGVSGANLKMRIEAILSGTAVKTLNGATKALLAAAGSLAIAAPVAIGLLHGVTLGAQTPSPTLKFEVASVRLRKPADGRGGGYRQSGVPGSKNNTDPGRFVAQANLGGLILTAYHLQSYQLEGAGDLYVVPLNVEAKMPVDTTLEEFEVMLQNLLAERLGLKAHWSTREMTLYELTVAKGGPKLKPAAPDAPVASSGSDAKAAPRLGIQLGADGFPTPPPGNGRWMAMTQDKAALRGHNETAAEMAQEFAPQVGGPVTDATGLTGRYDYTVFWSTAGMGSALTANAAPDPDGPSLFDAIREQLGLRLEKEKGMVKVLVIDHIEKTPTDN